MTYTNDYDGYRLSTGRTFYANRGLIGIASHPTNFELSEGYDGGICLEGWSAAELTELADFMIDQWRRFREAGLTVIAVALCALLWTSCGDPLSPTAPATVTPICGRPTSPITCTRSGVNSPERPAAPVPVIP